MAQKFKLIQRRNLGKDAAVTPTKMYAQAVNNGYVSFDELCADISELCSLTSADVKAVSLFWPEMGARSSARLPATPNDVHPCRASGGAGVLRHGRH